MPSITSWTRLEPRPPEPAAALTEGLAARLEDPLWLLARQWQVGEFQGEDAGTPIVARWRGRVAPMARLAAGPVSGPSKPFDPGIPLEAQVERQPLMRSSSHPALSGLRFAVESGQHFLRLLGLQPVARDYAEPLRRAYAVPPLTAEERSAADPDTLAYADLAAGRALDGRRLTAAWGDPAAPQIDPALGIAAGDVAGLAQAYRAWRNWRDTLFCEPAPDEACWQHERFEYTFSLSARLEDGAAGECTLTASQYDDGTLDWHSFDVNGQVSLPAQDGASAPIVTRTTLPAPVTLHGAPAHRFWEFEDPLIDLSALQVGATDVGHVLAIDAIGGYGNNWFVIPIDLPAGSLARSRSLVVTDTFGVRTLLQPLGPGSQSNAGWRMFSLTLADGSNGNAAAASNLFFLPPTLAQPLEGPVLEEVAIVRDELANVAWAIERRLESPLEEGRQTAAGTVLAAAPPGPPADPPLYRLASAVPDHWVPLLPRQVTPGSAEVRLVRGAVLDVSGQADLARAQARLLGVGEIDGPLRIPEEEAPREGLVVQRAYQAARWHDGRLFVWAGNKATAGSGEGSSGLAFDALDGV
jgi:hypothetical protein